MALTVTCTDDGRPSLSATQQLQVLIVETADVPKEVRLLGTRTVRENQPATVVGEIVVVNLLTEDPVAAVRQKGIGWSKGAVGDGVRGWGAAARGWFVSFLFFLVNMPSR